ncbi:MAG: regulatory protein RecX [Spirochaetales bacterium]|nr:MAG: regulatory protein RecX [Spirochaetales bacterium]
MVSGKPGENFSSPNGSFSDPAIGNAIIVEIKSAKNHRNTAEVALSDGFSFLCPVSLIEEEGLCEGLPVTDKGLRAILLEADVRRASETALRLLAASEHSCRQLEGKLLRRGFPAAAAGETVRRLSEEGSLSDRRYAEEWIRGRLLRRPEGPGLLVAGLRNRGIARELAEETVAAYAGGERERDAARRLIEKQLVKRSLAEEDLVKLLKSRGFSWQCIRAVRSEYPAP